MCITTGFACSTPWLMTEVLYLITGDCRYSRDCSKCRRIDPQHMELGPVRSRAESHIFFSVHTISISDHYAVLRMTLYRIEDLVESRL